MFACLILQSIAICDPDKGYIVFKLFSHHNFKLNQGMSVNFYFHKFPVIDSIYLI